MRLRTASMLTAGALTTAFTLGFLPGQALAAQPVTWNFTQMHIAAAQAAGHYGQGITVAVLDTWVDPTHPDFDGRVEDGADCVGGTCKAGLAPQDGCEPHGTHVSGIITSTTYGIAPRTRVMPIRVLADTNGSCSADSGDVARAISYAVAHGAKIINMSLGTAVATGSVADVTAAVNAATAKGVLVVAAAGNAQAPVGDAYGPNALIVAATGPSGQLASYSQRGEGVDLAASGGDPNGPNCTAATCVVSTWSNHQFAAYAGTSMAAPAVSAVAALLWAQKPSRTLAQVVSILESTASPLADAGSGLINAQKALGVTTPTTRSTPTTTPTPTHTAAMLPTQTATPKPSHKPSPKPSPTSSPSPTQIAAPQTTFTAPLVTTSVTHHSGSSRRDLPIGVAIAMLAYAGGLNLYITRKGRKDRNVRAVRAAYRNAHRG